MENNQAVEQVSGKELVEQRKNRRLFILFLVIDLIVIGLITYEIIAMIKNGIAAKEAAEAAKKATEEAANLIKFLLK